MLAVLACCAAAALVQAGTPTCTEPGTDPRLVLHTAEGDIHIRLLEEAAPDAVARLVTLARGPIFNPPMVAADDPPGFYDGLGFEFTRPHLEIATATRAPSPLFEVDVELDAAALGLDQDLIADGGEAMDVMQYELLEEHMRLKPGGGAEGTLRTWIDRLEADGNADFLVGTSRQQINEALGYRYTTGLASRPAVRGAVALRPASPRRATAQLTILLADHPQRTGRWMVVGEVTAGLEVAETISVQPLSAPPGHRDRSYRPRRPVVISSTEVLCR